MRQKLVMANWKLHGDMKLLQDYSEHAFFESEGALSSSNVSVVFCLPASLIGLAHRDYPQFALGAQHMSEHTQGAFTGEISANMLAEVGAQYVLIGHSERRQLYGESNALVAMKIKLAQEAGLTPVICIGETAEEREQQATQAVLLKQLEEGVAQTDFSNAVIAYEPVWAIGTGLTATPEQAQEVHAFIRQWLHQQDAQAADNVRILYGGSVKAANAHALFQQQDIDGGLVGGASLDVQEFTAICRTAQEH